MRISADSPNTFTPLTLSITIETPEELISLWHRTNINHGPLSGTEPLSDLWAILDAAAEKRGIKVKG